MAGQVKFTRDYLAWGSQVKTYEKSDDVGVVVSDFMWFEGYPFYPIGALVGGRSPASGLERANDRRTISKTLICSSKWPDSDLG